VVDTARPTVTLLTYLLSEDVAKMVACALVGFRLDYANSLLFGTHTHTQPFNGPFSGTTRVGRYQKGKTNLDLTEARDGE